MELPQRQFDVHEGTRRRTVWKGSAHEGQGTSSSYKLLKFIANNIFVMICLSLIVKDIAGYSGQIPVAVKTLTSQDPDVFRKFREEAELMKKFSHPNIISLLGERTVYET